MNSEEIKFDPSRLKKKKKPLPLKVESDKDSKEEERQREKEAKEKDRNPYTYDEMLKMLYDKCSHIQEAPKDKIPLPETIYENRKTFVSNFQIICSFLDRKPEHMMLFFKKELLCQRLGMSEKGVLWLEGRFDTKQILNVLRSYSKEFVDCNTCGGKKTKLIKENCTTVILCKKEECQGKRSTITLK